MVSSAKETTRSNEMEEPPMTQARAYHKRAQRAKQQRHHQARLRRLQRERERLRQEQQRAQHALEAVEQAVQELGLSETVAEDIQWHLQAQQKLLGKIVGMMFPPAL
jgi:hypothetical protein